MQPWTDSARLGSASVSTPLQLSFHQLSANVLSTAIGPELRDMDFCHPCASPLSDRLKSIHLLLIANVGSITHYESQLLRTDLLRFRIHVLKAPYGQRCLWFELVLSNLF